MGQQVERYVVNQFELTLLSVYSTFWATFCQGLQNTIQINLSGKLGKTFLLFVKLLALRMHEINLLFNTVKWDPCQAPDACRQWPVAVGLV